MDDDDDDIFNDDIESDELEIDSELDQPIEQNPDTWANVTLRQAGQQVTGEQARFLVDAYYAAQTHRLRVAGQIRSLKKFGQVHEIIDWVMDRALSDEQQYKVLLQSYAQRFTVGQWAMAQKGIGPVITAALIAYISVADDMNTQIVETYIDSNGEKKDRLIPNPHYGLPFTKDSSHLWSYAGMNPKAVWGTGQKRPWNATLKVLCWKIGDSFMKQSSRPGFYTQVYLARKAIEQRKNANGDFACVAKKTLSERTITNKKLLAVYRSGKLPDGRIELRARRVAIKLFLSHFYHVMYETHHGLPPERDSYAKDIMGHSGYYAPPGWTSDNVAGHVATQWLRPWVAVPAPALRMPILKKTPEEKLAQLEQAASELAERKAARLAKRVARDKLKAGEVLSEAEIHILDVANRQKAITSTDGGVKRGRGRPRKAV